MRTKINPYTPGAGQMPVYLAGRQSQIDTATQVFERLCGDFPAPSIAFSGYRGVGKTVLLNYLQRIAEDMDIYCYHMEIKKEGNFIARLVDSCKNFLAEISSVEKMKSSIGRALDAIKMLEVSFSPEKNSFSLSAQDRALYTRTDLSQSLEVLFEAIGPITRKKGRRICFFIDEFQYADPEELDAFIGALHRASQLSYPIMAVIAGTPEMVRVMYDKKTYVERLFLFPDLAMLGCDDVANALIVPVRNDKLVYSDDAVAFIFEQTKGYPYFVQQYGQIIYDRFRISDDRVITVTCEMAREILPEYYNVLDDNFYKVRFEYRGESEKEFLYAMAELPAPCTIADVANRLHKNVKSVAPTLSKLKAKGIVDNDEGLIFTAPGFGDYLLRRRG